MIGLSLIQAAILAVLAGPEAAAITSGVFLLLNTTITLILTRARLDQRERKSRRRKKKKRRQDRLDKRPGDNRPGDT